VPALLTVGHGTLDRVALQRLLQDAAVELVVDVRRYPGSRRNADVQREALEGGFPPPASNIDGMSGLAVAGISRPVLRQSTHGGPTLRSGRTRPTPEARSSLRE
jgi:hypothetical protein